MLLDAVASPLLPVDELSTRLSLARYGVLQMDGTALRATSIVWSHIAHFHLPGGRRANQQQVLLSTALKGTAEDGSGGLTRSVESLAT